MKHAFHHFFVVLIIAFIAAPVAILFFQPVHLGWADLPPVFEILFYSSLQALASSALALIFGFAGGIGLVSLTTPAWIHIFEAFAMVPAFLPPIFIIVSVLNLTAPFGHFPYGLLAVIAVHALMNVGYVATRVRRLFGERVGVLSELAVIEGTSRLQFLAVVIRLLAKDLRLIFFVIFCLCLTSFAVPLMLGGVHGATLEVLIYSRYRSGHNLAQAVGFSFVQIGILFMFGLMLFRDFRAATRQWPARNVFAGTRFLICFAIAPTVLILGGLCQGLPAGVHEVIRHFGNIPLLYWCLCSLIMGLTVGLGVLAFSVILVWAMPHPLLKAFLLGFTPPSIALVGLGLVLLGSTSMAVTFLKIIVGLILIFTPVVFRWILLSPMFALDEQIESAELLGASRTMIFAKIVFPQLSWSIFQGAALAAVWGTCDFSLSTFVANGEWTLPLAIQDLLDTYRPELATGLLWILFAVAALCYFIFAGVGHGLDRRFSS